MNLQKLFEIQAKLDKRIVEDKGLENEDLLPKKILALQVELGELANEWRGFKFWSKDQEKRTKNYKLGEGSPAHLVTYNPLLEEYVDCLHFILSIGLEINVQVTTLGTTLTEDILTGFSNMYQWINKLTRSTLTMDKIQYYGVILDEFIKLGELLGFTEEQIEQAYLDKNKINHERQTNGY